jgi:hypothetical protein
MSQPLRPSRSTAGPGLGLSHARTASSVRHPAPPPRPAPPAPSPAAPLPLRVLVAGADRDTRSFVEKSVREALAAAPPDGPCTVSLVKLGDNWSVTVDGPGERRRTLSVDDETLLAFAVRDAIRLPHAGEADAGHTAKGVKPEDAPPLEVRDHFTCPSCRQGLEVVYESHPDEPKEQAPVACPHCWKVGFVRIGAWAAVGRDYRCEKA